MDIHQILFKTRADARRACVGILGGGGKTTLLHAMARDLATNFDTVVVSSLTRDAISEDQPIFLLDSVLESEDVPRLLRKNSPIQIMKSQEDQSLTGLAPEELLQLHEEADVCVFECDGARKRPLKAHTDYDPALPEFTSHGIIVVGADAVGARVESRSVHRVELFRERWDVKATFEMSPEFIAKVLTSKYGYLEKVPDGLPLAYVVNKADAFPREAQDLSRALARVSKAGVFVGSLEQRDIKQVF